MKVNELIKTLQTYNPNAKVVTHDGDDERELEVQEWQDGTIHLW